MRQCFSSYAVFLNSDGTLTVYNVGYINKQPAAPPGANATGAPATLRVSGSAQLLNYKFVLDGAVSAAALNGLALSLPETVSGALAVTLVVSHTVMDYGSADPAFRHLFNLEGLGAVLHYVETVTNSTLEIWDLELWVGNSNGESSHCARGFSVLSAWSPDTPANLTFSFLANGSIGDLLLDGVAMPPASSVDTFFFEKPAACAPITIDYHASAGQLWVGGSGNLGYDDNWSGVITFLGLEYAPLTYNVSAAPVAGKKNLVG